MDFSFSKLIDKNGIKSIALSNCAMIINCLALFSSTKIHHNRIFSIKIRFGLNIPTAF